MSGHNSDVRKLRIFVTGTRARVPEFETTAYGRRSQVGGKPKVVPVGGRPEHFSSFCSYIIKSDQENAVVSSGSRRLGSISTKKTAQYQGLIFGMRACAKLDDAHPTDLEFVSDFSMCVNHMKTTCEDDSWKAFYHIARGLVAHLESLSWVRSIAFSHAATGDVDIAAAHQLAKTKAGEKIDLDNFNLDALTYYPNLCSMSIFCVAKDDGSWSSPFAGSNDIGAIVSDQAMYIDADYLASTHGIETFEILEDPGRLSWIDARGGSFEVLGVFKGTIKLKADLIAGFKIESVVNVNRFVVVHKLPVPLHVHVGVDESKQKMNYGWKGVSWTNYYDISFTSAIKKVGDDGVEKVPKYPLMANFKRMAKKYQEHPFWHVNPSVEFVPVGKQRIIRDRPKALINAGGAEIGQPHHFHSVQHDDY